MQNLRSSRETELAREYPLQTVTAWLGNTSKVALENDLQVRDEDFTKVAQILASTGKTVSHRVPSGNEEPLVSQAKLAKQGVFKTHRVPPLGLEPSGNNEKSPIETVCFSGAFFR